MDYTKIDPKEADSIGAESLKQQARANVESSFALLMNVVEGMAHNKAGRSVDVTKMKSEHAIAKRESDAYTQAAALSDEEVKSIQSDFCNRWVEDIERRHIHHSALLKVKASLGEPTASYDDILSALDVSHKVAVAQAKKLQDTTSPK